MAWTVPSEYMLQACVRLLFLLLIFWQILIKHSLPSISFASGGDGVSQKERERGGGERTISSHAHYKIKYKVPCILTCS